MKKTTLFRVFTFILLIGLLASCSKHTDKPANPGGGNNGGDDDNGGGTPQTESYYVKMKMDGAALSYTGSVKAIRDIEDDGTTHMLQIQGIKGGGSTDEVDLVVLSAADATTGDYTEGNHDTYAIFGVYAPQNRADDLGIYYGGIHLDETAPFTIKITEMTDKYVKGTFSGTFYDNEGNGTNKKVFTEGEFKAPIQ
jgi:hypothetical protein